MPPVSVPAVLLLGFNRPDCFRQLVAAVRVVKPDRVYVAMDGPRTTPQHARDGQLCEETRQALQLIDWPCQLQTRLQPTNLGCADAVSSAINWFFSQEAEGIILEDDCLPAPGFFTYAAQMLELFRDDHRVMHINGCNMIGNYDAIAPHPYAFSHLAIIWGWATWRRAWQGYAVQLREADVPALGALRKPGLSVGHSYGIRAVLLRLARKRFSTWDYQWMLKVLREDGVCVTPRQNLIKNIGFGANATLTTNADTVLANLPYGDLEKLPPVWPRLEVRPHQQLNHHLATACFGPAAKLTWKLVKDWIRGNA